MSSFLNEFYILKEHHRLKTQVQCTLYLQTIHVFQRESFMLREYSSGSLQAFDINGSPQKKNTSRLCVIINNLCNSCCSKNKNATLLPPIFFFFFLLNPYKFPFSPDHHCKNNNNNIIAYFLLILYKFLKFAKLPCPMCTTGEQRRLQGVGF